MRRKPAPFVLALALVAGLGPARSLADLRGPRDVTRALAALSSEDPERRARAAGWLALHGPDERVAPALVASLEREQAPAALVPVATALARRARPEDGPRLLELEPRLRAPARALVTLALAQLGTPEADAWLVTRLAEPPGGELRAAYVEVAELARARREALLPAVLERLAQAPTPLLVEWAASLADERLRASFLVLSAGEPALALAALEGLAALGPDPETAARLREQLAQPLLAAGASGRTLAVARALSAADPRATELDALVASGEPAVRAALLEALVTRAPDRVVALLGEEPAALAPADRPVLREAVEHPSPPLAPWLRALARDERLDEAEREAALDALVRVPSCDEPWLDALALPSAVLARARLARLCGARLALGSGDPDALHLRAIAGEDVRGAVRARWQGATAPERLALAHAWLSGRERDDALAAALEAEPDADVFAVLAAAASRWGVRVEEASLRARLEDPETRLAALSLVPAVVETGDEALALRGRRALQRALGALTGARSGARSPELTAAALQALARLARPDEPGAIEAGVTAPGTAHACAALERDDRALRGAALALLGPSAACVRGRARVDPALRALLARRASPPAPPREDALVLRVVSNVGGALPRVEIAAEDGRLLVLRPPPSGLVYLPAMGPAHAAVD